METQLIQTYSSKSTALRGAKRMGIAKPDIAQNGHGRWIIKLQTVVKQAPVNHEPIQTPTNIDLSKPESIVPRRTGVKETYNELEAIAPIKSTIASPVTFIWAFLDLNPDMERKEAISILVKNGCNINTARSQYQQWRTAGGVNRKR